MQTHRIFKNIVITISLGLLIHSSDILATTLVTQENIQNAREHYGQAAAERLQEWQALVKNSANQPELKKLALVNQFFDKIPYVLDQDDYWMTPLELIEKNKGDCEDFAIAKYFTLKAMGVNEERLRITYVKAIKLNLPHMVLTYYPTVDSDPLVLDILTKEILPSSQRTDLIPVYSFNADSLWLAQQRGLGQYVGSAKRLSKWQELQRRMSQQEQTQK